MTDSFEKFIKDNELTMQAQHVSTRPDSSVWADYMIHFHVIIRNTNTVVWSGFYSVGKAYPQIWAREGCKIPSTGRADSIARHAYRWIDNKNGLLTKKISVRDKENWRVITSRYTKHAPLEISNVLESLQMDSLDWELTFEDWADNLGYDSDSRRAEKIFKACQDTAKNLRASLGIEQFERLLALEN